MRPLRWVYDRTFIQIHDGIRICDATTFTLFSAELPVRTSLWRSHILQALNLIEEHDPKRYRRIRKQMAYLVNSECVGGGKYNRFLRACEVDFPRFQRLENEEWCLLELARTLVHEATHGAIFSWTIPRGVENLLRAERLCYQEEVRFLRRVRPGWEQPAFDERWHRELYQGGRWQRVFRYIRRYVRRMRQAEHPAD